MDQLVALQEIYSSFLNGGDGLKKIDINAIEGGCSELIGKLVRGILKGGIDEDVCRELFLLMEDVYGLKRLGDICRRAGRPELAVQAYKRALSCSCDGPVSRSRSGSDSASHSVSDSLYDSHSVFGHEALRPVLQSSLGVAYSLLGETSKAAFHLEEAARAFRMAGDRTALAHVLGSLGTAYRRNGEWERAIEHSYRSLKSFEEEGDEPGVAQMTGSLGRIYADMGERELAARYFERSLADFESLGDRRSAAWVLDRLGRIASERRDWDRALGCYHSGLNHFADLKDATGQGTVLTNIGCTLLAMGEPAAAREPLERAALLLSHNSSPERIKSLRSLAKSYHALGGLCLEEAIAEREPQSSVGHREEAARFFEFAAARYQELAGLDESGRKQALSIAALERSRAELTRISERIPEKQALALAEKALTDLDDAAALAGEERRVRILRLQRIVSGMKEALLLQKRPDDPKIQDASLINCSEYLMGAAREISSCDAGSVLTLALKGINASIQAGRSGRDKGSKLQSSAELLHLAGERFRAASAGRECICARMIERASGTLQGTKASEDVEREASGRIEAFRDERRALIAVSEAMMEYTLDEIERLGDSLTLDGTEERASSRAGASVLEPQRESRNWLSSEEASPDGPEMERSALELGERAEDETAEVERANRLNQVKGAEEREPLLPFIERKPPKEAEPRRLQVPPSGREMPLQPRSFEDGVHPPNDELEGEGTERLREPSSLEFEEEKKRQQVSPRLIFLLKLMAGIVAVLLAAEAALYFI